MNQKKVEDLVEEVLEAITDASETLTDEEYDIFIGLLRDEI